MKTRQRFLILHLALALLSGCTTVWTAGEVPFIPTPMDVVERMLDLAEVRKGDVIYDLGSGDGRIIIRAAKKYGARGVGIEIDPDLVRRSQAAARREGIDHLVEFREQDALKVDVSPATVVTLYMLPGFNEKLRPVLQRQLRPGARVVSHDFPIEGWTPIRTERLPGGWLHDHTIYLWKIEEQPH
ncbi:MAG: class I SAM-dependent methyltransferase [Deltaproteobacteria bacterium]|nr:class I SAM-dependent methyltransferase [Deltaproteobacteria bacterium]